MFRRKNDELILDAPEQLSEIEIFNLKYISQWECEK